MDDLIQLLDLEQIEENIFRGQTADETLQRVFGGQVAGQALVAAYRTIDGWGVHSLHSYFLRPGDASIPIIYQVERIRDGRSFATRRVVAIQHGRPIFHLTASFHVQEDGFEHHLPAPTNVPDPESLPDFRTRYAKVLPKAYLDRPRPIDIRVVPQSETTSATNGTSNSGSADSPSMMHQFVWVKASGEVPDDPVLDACILTYASDMTLLDSVNRPHGVSVFEPDLMMASLDHAMWFHRPFRTDHWLLYAQDTPSASGARGLARGLIFQDDKLVVSVVQEGLIRRKTK